MMFGLVLGGWPALGACWFRLLMAEPYETRECDVLVIGAGGAGMRAAIAAADAGRKVLVVTKSLLGKAHTVMAEGGIAAGLGNVEDADSWEVHFADTMPSGNQTAESLL